MGSDIFGALFASVSGLDAQSTNLSIIANNISNANTIGYKGAQVEFQTLVSGIGTSTNFASGGVTADNRQLIDQQGLLQSTSSPTDIAIQGSGLFVVNTNAASTGQVLYTRAGSFTQDSSGNFVNAAGYYLQAWPLDSNGLLPGAPGNTTDTTSSANLSSLQTVNVENVAGKASATSKVSISANLNAAQSIFPGASDTVTMDKNNSTDYGITADTVILPDAPPAGGGTQATGSVTFAANPANNDTIVLNGVTWTFKSSGASGTQTNLQGSLAATMTQLAADLNASANASIDVASYAATATGIDITYKTGTSAGDSYTLATGTGAANETVSGADLAGYAPGVDGIVQGDQMTISTGSNPAGYTFTYGGITYSRNITNGTDGASGVGVQGAGTLGTTDALTFSASSPTTMVIPLSVAPSSLGIQAGTVVKLAGTSSNGLAVNNVTSMDGNYYATAVNNVAGNYSVTVTIPSGITAPSAMSLTGATFTSTNGSDAINVTGATLPAGLKDGDTVVFSGIPAISTDMTSAVLNNSAGWVVSNVGVPGAGDFTFTTATTETGAGANSTGASSTTMFDTGGDLTAATATVSSRLFSGNILDASSATAAMINTPSDFTSAALSFTIQVGSNTPSTFTYQAAAPNASLGQFNTLDSLATAISDATGLTARVVNGQLYVAAVDGTQSITFANGSATGSNTSPPLAGIDWVGELGLANVSQKSGRFSTMQGLANLVNASPGLTATVNNPLGTSTVKINVNDPLDTITFADGATTPPHTNTGSLLGELGLDTSLNSVLTSPEQTVTFTRAYDPSNSTKNMSSGAITPQFSRSITVYDSLGTPHNLNTAFLKSGSNTWEVEIYAQPASDVTSSLPNGQVANGTLTFNGDGSLESVTSGLSGAIPITWNDGASPSSITINWGTAGAIGTGKTDGMSQFSSPFSVNFVNQNGAPVGALTGISISSTGLITASFSNGQTQNLYQIPLASFTDPDQLEELSGNVFAQTANSGQVNLQQIGATSVGTIASSSLEESNVELATQLTNMIVAQQAYQANTKVIGTADTLLNALDQIFQ